MKEVALSFDKHTSFLETVNAEAAKAPTFVFLYANKDANGEPIIRKTLGEVAADATLVMVEAGEKPVWRDQGNYYRRLEALKASAVPTLAKWGKSGKLGMLTDVPDCGDVDKIKQLASL